MSVVIVVFAFCGLGFSSSILNDLKCLSKIQLIHDTLVFRISVQAQISVQGRILTKIK